MNSKGSIIKLNRMFTCHNNGRVIPGQCLSFFIPCKENKLRQGQILGGTRMWDCQVPSSTSACHGANSPPSTVSRHFACSSSPQGEETVLSQSPFCISTQEQKLELPVTLLHWLLEMVEGGKGAGGESGKVSCAHFFKKQRISRIKGFP